MQKGNPRTENLKLLPSRKNVQYGCAGDTVRERIRFEEEKETMNKYGALELVREKRQSLGPEQSGK